MQAPRGSQQQQGLKPSSAVTTPDCQAHKPYPQGRGRQWILGGFLALVLLPGVSSAADKMELKGETGKINYSVGYQIGGDFQKQGVALDPEAMVQGIKDAINQSEPLLSQEQMNTVLIEMKKKIVAEQKATYSQEAAKYRQASADFLEENAKREGVTVLPDGVQYRIISAGTGNKPTLKDEVKVHFRVSRVDGKEVGNTYDSNSPRTIALAKALPGLQEVLPLMPEGSKWQIVLPTGTAAGGKDPMDDQGVIIYEMELVAVMPGK